MEKIEQICKAYSIALCYIFGSKANEGLRLIKGERVEPDDPESDIDFGVLFIKPPEDPLKTYALLSLELEELVSPFRPDLLFLHEVDHLIQLEAIKGLNIYAIDEKRKEEYEEKVLMFASDELEIMRLNEKDMFEAIEDGYFQFEYKAD